MPDQEQITVIAHIEIKPGTETAFSKEIPAVVAATRAEEACLNYDYHQSVDVPTKFVVYENWKSMEGLQKHSASAHIQQFRENCAEMFAQPVIITIWKKLD